MTVDLSITVSPILNLCEGIGRPPFIPRSKKPPPPQSPQYPDAISRALFSSSCRRILSVSTAGSSQRPGLATTRRTRARHDRDRGQARARGRSTQFARSIRALRAPLLSPHNSTHDRARCWALSHRPPARATPPPPGGREKRSCVLPLVRRSRNSRLNCCSGGKSLGREFSGRLPLAAWPVWSVFCAGGWSGSSSRHCAWFERTPRPKARRPGATERL